MRSENKAQLFMSLQILLLAGILTVMVGKLWAVVAIIEIVRLVTIINKD